MERSKLTALIGASVVALACGGKDANNHHDQPAAAGFAGVAGSGGASAGRSSVGGEQPSVDAAGSGAGSPPVPPTGGASDAGGEGGAGGEADFWPVPEPDPDSEAVAFQINPQHDGNQPHDQLRLPLQQRWAYDFEQGADVGYAALARGRVFVTVGEFGVQTRVVALSAKTGALLWSSPRARSTYCRANLAYEDERVFSATIDSVVSAYDAATGQVLWSIKLEDMLSMPSEPVAVERRVYVSGYNTLYALSGLDGSMLWTAALPGQPHASPTVANGVVYLVVQDIAFAFDAQSGAALWQRPLMPMMTNDPSAGSNLGGGTAPVSDGVLYVRSQYVNRPLDLATGLYGEAFKADPTPAVLGGWLITAIQGKVRGIPPAAVHAPWSFGQNERYFDSAAVVVGDKLAAMSIEGSLVILDRNDGKLLSNVQLTEGVPREAETQSGHPVSDLTAAANLLLVPVAGRLLAY